MNVYNFVKWIYVYNMKVWPKYSSANIHFIYSNMYIMYKLLIEYIKVILLSYNTNNTWAVSFDRQTIQSSRNQKFFNIISTPTIKLSKLLNKKENSAVQL